MIEERDGKQQHKHEIDRGGKTEKATRTIINGGKREKKNSRKGKKKRE